MTMLKNRLLILKIAALLILLTAVMTAPYWAPQFGLPEELPDVDVIRDWIAAYGAWGPLAVVATMTLAILVSPIPSAPIALASGAVFGHLWGSVYVLAGSVTGAVSAFLIARFLGRDMLLNWFGDKLKAGHWGSQNVLMGVVFASRLLPFISFDIVSYAAGLSVITFWRFALATLAGIAPASFLLGHFGSELVAEETGRILIAIVLLGALTVLPVIARIIITKRRKSGRS
jgi:uncharacterized membrane protein YdjX (TVP38/TMEM64 family)